MKNVISKITLMLLAGTAAATLASCSIFGTGGNKVKKDAVLPQDREQILINASAKTYSPEELSRGIVKGDWAIMKVDDKDAVGERAPFLKFVPEQKRVYGNNGCNVINAGYSYNPADSTLRFDKVVTTMMACAMEGITDYEINLALESARFYSWELKGSEYYLYLYNGQRRRVMELMHQNFDFLNGVWRVTAIDDEPIDVEDMKLVIDVDEGKLHGNTGCNVLNGTLETDMEAANSISFQAIAVTAAACPEPNYETRLIVALEDATQARPISSERVILLDGQGKSVLQLARVNDGTTPAKTQKSGRR